MQDQADLVLFNGKIITVDAEDTIAQAVAVKDRLILDVGTNGQPPTSYTYDPHPGPSYEIPTWDPSTLKDVVKSLHNAGHQLAFHVMGDRAIDLALDAIEEAVESSPRADHRHRLEHCMIPTPEAIDRIKRLGVVISAQPGAIITGGDGYISVWGAQRIQRLMPLRSFLSKGITLALGSDFPTVPHLSPQLALWASIARVTASGRVIAPQESITIQEALRAHTMGSAYAGFEENIKGSIEKGKFADMDVWSEDLYSIPIDRIKNIRTIVTIVGGQIVTIVGDVTDDERVDVNDFVRLTRFILQLETPTEAQKRKGDIATDDELDVRDLTALTILILDDFTP